MYNLNTHDSIHVNQINSTNLSFFSAKVNLYSEVLNLNEKYLENQDFELKNIIKNILFNYSITT